MERSFAVGPEARKNLLDALSAIALAVGSTLGPGGRQFGFDKLGTDMRLSATFSKDGLTVLKSLSFKDPAWQAVLQYCKQAAFHSVAASGDGTTSTIVLAEAVARAVANSGFTWPQAFARQIEQDSIAAIDAIRKEAIKTDDAIRLVAMTSTNGDSELTDVVLDAIKYSSAYGTILVEKNPASPVRYKISKQDGYSNCGGYNYNPTLALSASAESASSKPIEWTNPHVIIFNGNLITAAQIDPICMAWNELLKAGEPGNLIIVCYEISDEIANKLMVLNRTMAKYGLATFVVKPRLTAEINSGLQVQRDIAAFCGIDDAKIVDGGNFKDLSNPETSRGFFGSCGKIKVTTNSTMFLGRAENHWVEKRVQQNHSITEEARSEFDRQITAVRNAELAEGLVKVEVGGGHLADLQERADRFDDASKATQSCMVSGALPGAGCSYIRAGLLAGVHPALATALRAIHESVLSNYGTSYNPDYIPLPGHSVSITKSETPVHGMAVDLGILDAADTVCAVIKNGVSLGVRIATLGGYSYRDLDTQPNEYEG
jgi:chaperonin GroEL